jgi:hypothetical protein
MPVLEWGFGLFILFVTLKLSRVSGFISGIIALAFLTVVPYLLGCSAFKLMGIE